MKKLAGLLLFSMLLSLPIFGSVNAYDNAKYHFSITPPAGWQINEGSNDLITSVTFHSPENQTSANINVVVSLKEMEGLSINDIFPNSSAISSYLGSFASNYTLLYDGWRTVNCIEGYELIYTVPYKGAELKIDEIVFIENDLKYTITGRTLSFDFGERVADFEETIESFKIDQDSNSFSTGVPEFPFAVVLSLFVFLPLITIFVKKKLSKGL
jgi:hypothetical protein